MALLDDGDLAYMRATQGEAMPTEAVHTPLAPAGKSALGGRTTTPGTPDAEPVFIRVDNDPRAPEPLSTKYGIHLVRLTCPVALTVATGDTFRVSATEVYEIVSHGDTDPWTTAQRLWAIRVVRAGA